jgi:arsenate reductase
MILEDSKKVEKFFKEAIKKATITNQRKVLLKSIAQKASDSSNESTDSLYLNFICTHNSRRSQLAQVWAYFASDYFNIPKIQPYSGGTAVTSFYKNTVKTLQSAGFTFNLAEFNHQNPKYEIRFNSEIKPLLGFSKLYDNALNSEQYIAITTCSSADENCPFIPNALFRFHLPFNDPKEFDDTEYAEEAYLKASRQIAAEIYILFQEIKNLSA